MPLISRSYRVPGSVIIFVTLISLNGLTAVPQTVPPERSFPTQENPRITISNASTVSITSWDRNEVSVAAQVSGVTLNTTEVNIKPEKNKLAISCHPTKPDRQIYLTLRVPTKAILQIKSHGNEVQIKEPVGQITVMPSRDLIQLSVPETASLDMRNAPNAVEHRQIGQGGFAQIGLGRRGVQGAGPTQVQVTAETATVIVARGFISPVTSVSGVRISPPRPATQTPTIAAATIARRTSSMSRALRKSNPQLIRPQRDQPSTVTSSDTEEAALKLLTHLVNLNVSAVDRDGKAVAGLRQEDFSVYEDGVQQQISFFSPERSPFNLVLLIDLSGSMKDEIELIKETALHFLDVISALDSVAVVTFTTDVTVVSHFTKDRDDLRESIDWMLAPMGGTAFYDALGYALVEALRKVKGQRNAVIAITDGEDSSLQAKLIEKQAPGPLRVAVSGSFLTFEELLEGVTESDALVYPIHLNPNGPQILSQSRNNPQSNAQAQSAVRQVQTELTQIATKQLRSLSDASGARFYHANRIADLKGVFEQVAAELRTVYSMAYTPTNHRYDGSFRKIRVQVNSTDIVVRTRPGYYGR